MRGADPRVTRVFASIRLNNSCSRNETKQNGWPHRVHTYSEYPCAFSDERDPMPAQKYGAVADPVRSGWQIRNAIVCSVRL